MLLFKFLLLACLWWNNDLYYALLVSKQVANYGAARPVWHSVVADKLMSFLCSQKMSVRLYVWQCVKTARHILEILSPSLVAPSTWYLGNWTGPRFVIPRRVAKVRHKILIKLNRNNNQKLYRFCHGHRHFAVNLTCYWNWDFYFILIRQNT